MSSTTELVQRLRKQMGTQSGPKPRGGIGSTSERLERIREHTTGPGSAISSFGLVPDLSSESGATPTIQRSTDTTGGATRAGETQVPDSVRGVISSPGQSLDGQIQRTIEDRLGDSFGDVRIHTGPQAARACDEINARAFTVGNHIAFNAGEYDPSSPKGQHVLVHELAHVRQQTGGAISMLPQENVALEIDPDPQLEEEAEEVAQQVMKGGELGIQRMSNTEVHVQRYAYGAQNDSESAIPTESPTQEGMWAGVDGKIKSFLQDFSQLEFRLEPAQLENVAEKVETKEGLYQFLEHQGIEATSDLEQLIDKPLINSWKSASGSMSLLGLLGMGFTPAAAAAVLMGVSAGVLLHQYGGELGDRAQQWLEERVKESKTRQADDEDSSGDVTEEVDY